MKQKILNIKNIESKINYRDIKSSFTIKRIFSFLKEKEKLNIIIYNKKFQKLCLIDIEDYKQINGKYKIGKKNGKGKEYIIETKILIFEGEYLNGIKNGKGKEYYKNGKLKFEGEYLNGKKWNGNGYIDGNMAFTIKYGKGNIKEYDYEGKLIFEGEYLNGKRNGKGKEYENDNLKFEGEYLNGEKNGKGKEYFRSGQLKFKGQYLIGKKWNGNSYNINGNIEFEIKDGAGYVKEYNFFNDNLEFEGEYLNGKEMEKGKNIIMMIH